MKGTILAALVLALALPVVSAEDEAPADWRKGKLPADLDAAAVERLAKDKVLLGQERFKQVFSPYIGSKLPVFVTSDSILNAYHVVFEESVLRLERTRSLRLAAALRHLWLGIPDALTEIELDENLTRAAERRVRCVLGTALLLLGEELPGASEEILALTKAEADRVTAAEGMGKPEWLGPPDRGFTAIDYGRFRPRGFYDRSEGIKRYFRAAGWLMAIPFRVNRDDELVAIVILEKTLGGRKGAYAQASEAQALLAGYRELLGRGDDASFGTASGDSKPFRASSLKWFRDSWREKAGPPLIGDLVAYEEVGPSWRILSPSRTPDAVLFHRTTNLLLRRTRPDGLEICAALGSRWAQSHLKAAEGEKLIAAIESSREHFKASGLYAEYLRCLARLLDEPEPEAPALFDTEPWKRKSCRTVLAGWAQLRHTWILQAKQTVHYLGIARTDPGYVEPDPEFFGHLARLCGRTRRLLARQGAFSSALDRLEQAEAIAEFLAVVRKTELEEPLTLDVWMKYFESLKGDALAVVGIAYRLLFSEEEKGPREWTAEDWKKVVEVLEEARRKLLAGEELFPKRESDPFDEEEPTLEDNWRRLGELCLELEALAHKQLRGKPLEGSDEYLLKHYGEELAGIMFYGGNSYLTPKDDAPRIADVHHDPNRGMRLLVGVGRPRVLYVLWPTENGEVLCAGGVMPYHEFERDGTLTDAEWREMSGEKPDLGIPSWDR